MPLKFDKNGYPDVYIGNNAIINFQDPLAFPDYKTGDLTTDSEPDTIGKYKYVKWFGDNIFPETAHGLIDQTPVLKHALRTNTKVTAAQGVFPAKVTGFNPDGTEILEIINDPELTKSLNKYIIRNYLADAGYDLNALGNSFVKLIPSLDGKSIVKIVATNARHCRLSEVDPKTGKSNYVLVHGDWENVDEKKIKAYILLDEDDPEANLAELRDTGKLKAPVMIQLRDDYTGNDYYSMPPWYAAKKWVDISNKVATTVDSGMDNMLNILYHIQIPYSYWDKKYPKDEFEGKEQIRKDKITEDIQNIEEKLTSSENAKKTLITFFGDPDADNGDGWKITSIENKFSQENVVTSSAADTQIAIAAGVNPDLLGLMYGNSKGGSMQRELLLIQYSLSWLDRQKLADVIELMIKFNYGTKYEDVVIRFRNTFLTTLDSGKATQTQMS